MKQKKMQLSEAMQKKMQLDQGGGVGAVRNSMSFDDLVSTANREADKMIALDDFLRPGTPVEVRLQRRHGGNSPTFLESELL
eukprot:SAG31_NODE_20052_length_585_cov_0.759259_1_plen_81_part_10